MSEYKQNKHMSNATRILAVLLCGAALTSTFYMYPVKTPDNKAVIALAEANNKEFKWTKLAVEKGTTIDTEYLWPDEINPEFTAVYRDGKPVTEKMVTVTEGSVYHFRGISDDSTLYTEVYVGNVSAVDVTSGETGTWYRLLPSTIRNEFEESGWTWETGWEYTGRAYLDSENNRVMIKNGDHTAVLYGMGLYLDNKHNYVNDAAFQQEGTIFKNIFGNTDNMFASALECYYTKGGELRSGCPKIYAMVADAMSQLDAETAQIRANTASETTSETTPETTTENKKDPALMKDLLEYANIQRGQAGLQPIAWNSVDDANIITRVKEVAVMFSQTRPDGSDAFSAYSDAVMCEMRLETTGTKEELFNASASYFLNGDVKSFNCAIYNNIAVLIFSW